MSKKATRLKDAGLSSEPGEPGFLPKKKFQPLEKMSKKVPTLGTFQKKVSNPWKLFLALSSVANLVASLVWEG